MRFARYSASSFWQVFTIVSCLVSPAMADDAEFTIHFTNDGFSPNTLEVPAGARIKIVLVNTSKGAVEFESLQLRKEKVLGPGATSFLVIRNLAPGRYEFFDDFHPSLSKATLIAKEFSK